MKVVYFNYLYDLYEGALGSTIKAQRLMKALEGQGVEVREFWLNVKKGEAELRLNDKVRTGLKKGLSRYLHELSQLFSNFRYFLTERSIIRRENPDLVICRHNGYLFSAALLARLYRIPFILEVDSPGAYEYRKYYSEKYLLLPHVIESIERLNFRLSKYGFVVSNILKGYALDNGLSEKHVRVIPNAADVANSDITLQQANAIRDKLALGGATVVGFVGTFHYWHGTENLMEIIHKTLSRIPDRDAVRFLLVGSGGVKEQELKAFIDKHDYGEHVIMTGFVKPDEVTGYIQAMDVVLAPYPDLTFFYYSPVKLFEYLAHGKAVLASRLGQISELIQSGKNGVLCDPCDVEGMVSELNALIQDREKRESLGLRAAKNFHVNHRWDNRGRSLYEFCKEVVGEHEREN